MPQSALDATCQVRNVQVPTFPLLIKEIVIVFDVKAQRQMVSKVNSHYT